MFRLPVCGRQFILRELSGHEEVLLRHAPGASWATALELLERLAQAWDGGPADLADLCITDFECLLLRLHQSVFGGAVECVVLCPTPACGASIDLSFRVDDYLAHHLPRTDESSEPSPDRPGWFLLCGKDVSFRLPTVADLVACEGAAQGALAIARRTLDPPEFSAPVLRQVERAMGRRAPLLSGPVNAACPECEADLRAVFDVCHFVMREIREQAAFVFEGTHLLARHYHWQEDHILAIPRSRRIQYAELLRSVAS